MSFLENISDECQFHQHTSDEWHRQYHYIDLVELYIAFINFIFGLTFNLLFFFLYIHLIQKKRSEIINEYHERYMNISNKIKRYQKKVLKCQRSSDIELISTKTLEDDISHQRISIRWSDEKKEDFTQNNFITSIDYDRKTTNVFDNLLRNDFRIFTNVYEYQTNLYLHQKETETFPSINQIP
ncbi:hypothetical protein SNEBB_000802 [Seison nebaliae]|nr:hypothetical protein SNEBB_000802 [Seison nebaliae]